MCERVSNKWGEIQYVVANVLNRNITVSEFEQQSRYRLH